MLSGDQNIMLNPMQEELAVKHQIPDLVNDSFPSPYKGTQEAPEASQEEPEMITPIRGPLNSTEWNRMMEEDSLEEVGMEVDMPNANELQ